MSEQYDDNIFTLKTVQISPIRSLITALKDILNETNIVIKKDCLKIVTMDKTHTILVHLQLNAKEFEFYECKKETIVIGVNMGTLFKIISMIENNDTLTIFIDKSDYNEGVVSNLSFKFQNGEINQIYINKMALVDLDNDIPIYPDVTYSSIISLPASDFQKIIRNFSSFSDRDRVEIKSVGNQLIFKSVGSSVNSELIRDSTSNESSMTIVKTQDKTTVIQGIFSLKTLSLFVKCTNLCQSIELYLDNDLPLVVKYNVASLGEIKLHLSPLPA